LFEIVEIAHKISAVRVRVGQRMVCAGILDASITLFGFRFAISQGHVARFRMDADESYNSFLIGCAVARQLS
jgi:hypothetical protein